MSLPVDSKKVPPTPTKPPRNPIERFGVWGGIGLLLLVVLMEYRAKQGYAKTLEALNTTTEKAEKEDVETTLAAARELFALSPRMSGPVQDGSVDRYTCSWFSLFKSGSYEITLVASRDKEPILLEFTTPTPPDEPAPIKQPESVTSSEGITPSRGGGMGMGGPGMGGPPGGGMGMGGGTPRPNPVREAIDGDASGDLSADEIAAAPTALTKLDKDADGGLSAEEMSPPPPPAAVSTGEDPRAAHEAVAAAAAATPPPLGAAPAIGGASGGPSFPNRLVAAMDTSGDGALSAEELAAAATGLKTLDADQDGTITREELRPPGGFGGGGFGGGPAGPGGGATRPVIRPASEEPASPTEEKTAPPDSTPPAEPSVPAGETPTPAPAVGTP